MLEIRNLTTGYGGIPVARDVTIRVGAGQVVTLLGPNGAGKTTTMLTVAGFLPAMQGEIEFDGAAITGMRTYRLARLGMGVISDDRVLLPSLTVRENLALIRVRKRDPFEIFPELEPLLDRPAGLLSGGEQQMLALARAFAGQPRLLLIDELSHGLAPVICERLFPLVRMAADTWGAAVLLVEQNVGDALAIADRGYVMQHGRIVIADEPGPELLNRRDVIEASYLGDVALTEGN